MKLKSDFLIEELNILLHSINLHVANCTNLLKGERRKAIIYMALFPWRKNQILINLAYNTSLVVDHVSIISKLREKIMKAEGIGERGVVMTLEEFYSKSQED